MDKVILIQDGQLPKKVTIHQQNPIPRCKRCGTKEEFFNSLINGYCIDCEEELEATAK